MSERHRYTRKRHERHERQKGKEKHERHERHERHEKQKKYNDDTSSISIPDANEHIKPGNDFYMYINSQWLDHVHIPAYMTSFGVSEEIELEINKELLQILSDSNEKSETISYKDLSGPTRLLGTLTHSILQRKEQKRNVKLVQSMLNSLHCVRSKEDIGVIIGEYLRYRIPTCMTIFTSPSETNSLKNYICFSTGNLGLIDTSYYTEKSQLK